MKNIYEPSYYRVLCLEPDATQEKIKSSYKGLLKIYHPDKNPNDENFAKEKTQEIREAFDALSNMPTKTKYDSDLKKYLEEMVERKIKIAEAERIKKQKEEEFKKQNERQKMFLQKFPTPEETSNNNKAGLVLAGVGLALLLATFLSQND